jgi:amino acid adenylation domain-containing protein
VTAKKLLAFLSAREIHVHLEDGKLKTQSPPGAITGEITALIKAHRDELISLLSADGAASAAAPRLRITPSSRSEETAAVTASQRQLWLRQKRSGDSLLYNVPVVVRLRGHLDKQALSKALQKVVERHEALRTQFIEEGGDVIARIRPSLALQMQEHRASGESSARVAESLVARPFDLSADPLLRADLLEVDAAEHVLVLCMHHIVTDGWSCGVLAKELEALYNAAVDNNVASLPELPIQYSDYADWLERPDQQQALTSGLDYWREHLRDVPPVHSLPLDFPRPRIQSDDGGLVESALPEQLTEQVRTFAAQQGCTVYMLLQAALALLISRWSNESDVVIGTASSGRIYPELENLVGFFVNPLILRNRIPPRVTVEEFLFSSKRLLLAAFEHQQVAFENIVEAVLPARSASHAPLFQIILDYQGASAARISLTGLDCQLLPIKSHSAKYDIEITATESLEHIHLRWIYAARLFTEQTIRGLQRSFELLLSEFVKSPRRCISELPFLPWEQLDFITRHAAGRVVPCQEGTFTEHFADAAKLFPDAVAVEYGGETLCYAELNLRANRIANFLRKMGLGEGGRAAIYLEPGPELVIAILAILKAGGAYVPIDPAYPQERVEYILEDSGAQIILTTKEVMDEGLFFEQKMVPVDQELHDVLFGTQPDEAPEIDSRDGLAYILYTSGSTGKPKGVMIRHRGLLNYLEHAKSYFTAGIRGAIVSSSICFDATITSLLTPLLLGKRVVLLESNLSAVFKGLKHYLLHDAHDWLFKITPAHLLALSHECAGQAQCSARHVLVIGGEQLGYAVVDQWQSQWLPEATYINEYGPTETVVGCSVFSVCGRGSVAAGAVPIGRPIANIGMYAIAEGRLVPPGVAGELYISGPGLAAGYVNLPELTEQRFVCLPEVEPHTRFYRTGDLVRLRRDGQFEFIKRCDEQIKIRGYRIETGEIESVLRGIDGVLEAAVRVQEEGQHSFLVAYLQPRQPIEDSKSFLRRVRTESARSLLEYMVPSVFELIEKMPLTLNGKVDKPALPQVDLAASLALSYAPPQSELEALLCQLWQQALGLERVGIHDNFMEIGGDSLLFVKMRADIESRLGRSVEITAFFEFPTIAELSRHLQSLIAAGTSESTDDVPESTQAQSIDSVGDRQAIAVIAVAGRFPGAANPEELWSNLYRGIESLQTYSDEELLASGFSAEHIANPAFVRSAAIVPGVELFDADFFKMTPREAEVLDPQQRLLFECSVEALERAGYGDSDEPLRCGVFVGCGESTYLAHHLFPNVELIRNLGLNVLHANSPNYAATRIAYKLNLSGPAVSVSTACSTSLVAIHQAINSLRLGECDMALAGGAGVSEFAASGYLYQEGGIESPDGRCRAFDQNARGTRGGNGAGIVMLKRLSDAMRDGDTILAVIKGSAINNDGSQKAGYTAPSVVGQAAVIESALRDAGVRAEQIQYVETHGTGTPLGDPIEFRALSKAFAGCSKQVCALGTLKPNIGHLDAAAGVASLIKVVKAIRHATMPPSINFERPNEMIDLAGSPFYFNTAPRQWNVIPGERRRAGLSAFGIGGTNVHMIIEEAPEQNTAASRERCLQLLPLSARTESALLARVRDLRGHLEQHREQHLADVAFTLQAGRKAHAFRTFVVGRDHDELIEALANEKQLKIRRERDDSAGPAVVFLFPGQGTQYAGMGLGLLGVEKRFTEAFEQCRALIERFASFDVLEAIKSERSDQTGIAQPALFAIEYSLAVHLMSLGIRPEAMIGHSLGEWVAACIAGVFELEDAVRLVCARARLMQASEPGAMLTISADRNDAERFYDPDAVSLAAVNGPKNYVLSGGIAQIDAIESRLRQADIGCRKLQTSHAFHSPMMQAAGKALLQEIQAITLQAPKIRFLSNVSGAFITEAEARDPGYWVRHLLSPVQFARGLESLSAELRRQSRETILVEVGPGNSLTTLARRNPCTASNTIVRLMRHAREADEDRLHWLKGLGALWAAGCELRWGLLAHERTPRRVQLPTYPFERQRYWVDRAKAAAPKSASPEDWFYLPAWRLSPGSSFLPAETSDACSAWLLLSDRCEIAAQLAAHIPADRECIILPAPLSDARVSELANRFAQSTALSIACLWAIGSPLESEAEEYESFRQVQRRCFHPLLKLVQTLLERCPKLQIRLHVVTDRVFRVTGDEGIRASLAPLRSLCKVLPQENPQVSCQLIDIDAEHAATEAGRLRLARQLWQEFNHAEKLPEVALRGTSRWVKAHEPLHGNGLCKPRQRLVRGGHYLITGGLGRIGQQLATWLAKDYQARITLISRRAAPPPGANIQVIRADVSDAHALEHGLSCAEQAFGPLNGIIHAAGAVHDSVVSVQNTDEEICERQYLPKVAGLINLEKALRTRKVDFCLVMSSLSVELGGLGFTAYAAANCFADAFVQRMRNASQDYWCSVDWDGWSPEEGIRAFSVALCHLEHPCLINSKTDLSLRFAKWITMSTQQSRSESAHGRPDISEEYEAPATRTEEALARLWQDVLGIERIGVNDNFFELGGDSLIATRLVAKIRAHFAVPNAVFSLSDFFASPVISDIADKLAGASMMSELEAKRTELRQAAVVEEGEF